MTETEDNHDPLKFVAQCYRALDDKKAVDIRILDVRGKSTVTDYLLLVSGTAEPHLKALRDAIEKVTAEHQVPLVGVEESPGSGWLVVDAFDVMIHLFLPQQRAEYQLERLWKDAREIRIEDLEPQVKNS